jgi:fumarylpyruvate hydrolase
MIWNIAEIISKLSLQVELGAGDVILTGTPAGVAALQPGDKVECGVDGIGTLKFEITAPK